ncbi:hypothetical protein [Azospirillum palustre]
MARKTKDNPTNLSADDIAHSLRTAAYKIPEAKESLEAARGPLRDIKAVVKATGIGWDIFSLVSGIANLDDQGKRDKRWRELLVSINAILKGKLTGDLLGFDVSISPAAERSLREASEKLGDVQPVDRDDEGSEPQDQDLPFDLDPPSVPEPEAIDEDLPALAVAEDMPEGAGYAFNNGMQAGRLRHDADANPHGEGTPERQLWEAGRAKGAAMGSEAVDQQDEQGDDEQPAGAEVTDLATAKRAKVTGADKVAAYFSGFDGAAKDLFTEDCPHDRGTLKTNWLLGLEDAKAGKSPRFVRPAAGQAEQVEQQDAAQEPNFDDQGLADTENGVYGDDEPAGRVEVREIDGKHVLFDLLDNAPLMDVSGPKTGETWANQINAHFSACLETATRTDLIAAAKTLASGRLLSVPTAPAAFDNRATA